jgi:hypothetical protein
MSRLCRGDKKIYKWGRAFLSPVPVAIVPILGVFEVNGDKDDIFYVGKNKKYTYI